MRSPALLWSVIAVWCIGGILYGWLGPLARAGRGRAVQATAPGVWAWLDRGLRTLTAAVTGVGATYLLGTLAGWLEPWGYSTPRAMAWSLLVLVGLGMALSGWGKATLGPNYTGGSALKVEHRLVTGGPYAWLRHPIYAGAILSYAATGALSGMWVVLVLGAGVIPVAYGLRIWLDERLLSRSFGQTYAAYRHDVALLGIRLGRRSGRQ